MRELGNARIGTGIRWKMCAEKWKKRPIILTVTRTGKPPHCMLLWNCTLHLYWQSASFLWQSAASVQASDESDFCPRQQLSALLRSATPWGECGALYVEREQQKRADECVPNKEWSGPRVLPQLVLCTGSGWFKKKTHAGISTEVNGRWRRIGYII